MTATEHLYQARAAILASYSNAAQMPSGVQEALRHINAAISGGVTSPPAPNGGIL